VRILRHLLLTIPALLALALALVLALSSPEAVERVYSRGIYPPVARALGGLSDLVPVSIAEVLGLVLVLLVLLSLIRGTGRLLLRRTRLRDAAARVGKTLLVAVPLVYVAFQGLWGIHYARLPLETRLHLDPATAPDRASFERNLEALVRAASRERVASPPGPGETERSIAAAVVGVDLVTTRMEGAPVPGARRPKTLLLNDLFRLAGVTGVTIPFTHEAHHRRDLLPCERPHVAAHERAHLAGFASEAEANFVAYHAGLASGDPRARYSARLGLLRDFLGAATAEQVEAVLPHLAEGVRADLRAIRERSRREASSLTRLTRRVNDTYLRANRVRGGVSDYGRVVRLVLAGERHGWGVEPEG
jgi:hypothetical protein